MQRQSASLVIARPPDTVFAYMDDVHREHEWQPNLREASQDPQGPSRVGTRKRYVSEFMGKRVENTFVVIELEPSRRVVYETTPDSTVSARTEVTWEASGAGTKVTMTLEGKPRGVLRFIPKAILESVYEQQLKETLANLKTRLEQG